MEQINQQIRSFILTSPNDQQLTNFLNQQLSPSIKPKLSLHQINTKTITKPTLVYARLMVQDIRDAYYYISFAMKRPFNPQDPYFLYKYGHEPQNEPQNVHQNKQYINVFTDRYTVVGTPIRYQSKWMDEAQGRVNDFEQILIEVDGQANYKLGQILNIVAFYDPDLKKLFMVREIDNQQAYQAGLQTKSVNQQLSLQSISATRYQLMNWLSSYASQTFSQLLLFSLISDQTFFLGCEADISALVAEIYPRVAHIKLVHPCNKPLFPFKNEEGELQLTDMQMSILPTFVSIDFSQFSKQQKVVVEGNSLSNLSGLKMFVQDGKTIYKWQIGESHYQHPHRGIIVKASQLISPHFNPKNQKISLQYGNLNMISQSKKQMFRTYLRDISQLNPCLKDDERKLIEKQLMDCKQKQKLGGNLVKIMSLSKLRAKSYGREIIGLQDFRECKKLLQECENGG